MTDFGKWLRDSRKRAGLTQGELGKRAKISTSYVSTLERGERHHLTNAPPQPAPDVVEAIGEALGVPIDEARLAAGYAPKNPTRKKPENVIEFLEVLESWGLEFGPGLLGDKRLHEFTPEEFEDLLYRINRDVASDIEITLRRKER